MSKEITQITSSGERVILFRNDKNLSQQELADSIGVSRGYIGDIERNRSEPSSNFLTLLASKFNVSVDWLLTGRGEMHRTDTTPNLQREKYTNSKFNFKEVTGRLKKVLNIKTDLELAAKINMKPAAFNRRKKLQSLPYEEILELANIEKIDFYWLLTGEGEMYRQPIGSAALPDRHTGNVMQMYEALNDVQRREILSALEEKQQLNQLMETVHQLQLKIG
jgi:transcriptional regulator with XRE-family HTH domain